VVPSLWPHPASGTPISRALHAQTSREHVGPWVVGNHIEFMFLRESSSSDSANQFVSATAIQLPSHTTYQQALIDPRDGIMLSTELDDHP